MIRQWRFSSMKLQTKFVLPISAIMIACLVVLAGYMIQRQSESYHRELESKGETMIKILAINAEIGVIIESPYELDALLGTLSHFGSVEYCLIQNLEGTKISHVGQNPVPQDTLQTLRNIGRESMSLVSGYLIDREGEELFVLISPILTEKKIMARETLGMTGGVQSTNIQSTVSETIGWIELGMSVKSVNQATADATKAAVLLALIVLGTTILVVIFIVKAVLRPITTLVEATDKISHGDFSTTVPTDRDDEIGQLAKTFNQMTASLRQSRDEIEQYNRTLEEKIIERTQQLDDAQAQLIQSEKMGAIGQLAAGVAHELNNPLGGILGYAQFTLEKLNKNTPEKTTPKEIASYLRYVGDIEAQARRCKTIVQNLLRFSRSSRTVDFDTIDINQAMEETLTFVEHQLRINNIELEVQLGTDLPTLQGNAGQLQQVFTNLIINAMHASEPNSTLGITSRYHPALGEFGGTVEFKVADSGHGIAQEDLKKIFEPFFTTKEVGKGTGLGLSVSYGIVKEHGGEITVESEVGKGTTFAVILPVQKKEAMADIHSSIDDGRDSEQPV
jgi:signal transduction histidine kinase